MNVNRGWHAGKRDTLVMGLALLLALLTTVPGMAQTHSGQVTMSFQGRLLDSSGEPRSDETHCMRFRMCTDDTNCGNTQVWPSVGYEKHAVTTESGTYKAGLFSVVLGTFNPIQPSVMNNDLLYVEVGVADESSCPGATWTTMTPRSQVRTNAYAMYSRRVYTLEEADADCLVTAMNSGQGGSVYASTESTTNGVTAGTFYAGGTHGETYGILVHNDSTSAYAAAGRFEAAGETGMTDGVSAINNSTSNDATAGHFWTLGESGRTNGVYVRNDSTTDGARAGHFLANGTSGKTYSVVGLNHSTNADSVGGYFHADYGVGVYAWSDHGNPIEAYSSSTDLEFRVTNSGEVYADGNFHSGGADFAEMLPGGEDLEPGDVLVVGPDGNLMRSTDAYQTTVVGVYSTNPALVGGSDEAMENPGKVPLAVVGIVPVKASAENGAIQLGDLLVASSTPGHAMRGGDDPPQGTVIGKALEALESGSGVIQMLVTLQ